MAQRHRRPQLPGKHPRPFRAQAALLRRRWGYQQMKPVLLETVEIEMPRNGACPRGGRPESRNVGHRTGGDQPMMQPVRMGEVARVADMVVAAACGCRRRKQTDA